MILLIMLSVLMKRVMLLGVEGTKPTLFGMTRSSSGLRTFRDEHTSPFALLLMIHIWSRLVASSGQTLFPQIFKKHQFERGMFRKRERERERELSVWAEERTWNEREGKEEERETGFNCSSSSMIRREICLLMSAKKTSSSSSNSIALYLLCFSVETSLVFFSPFA